MENNLYEKSLICKWKRWSVIAGKMSKTGMEIPNHI